MRRWLLAAALAALAVPEAASAHGIGEIRDLPVPGWLFFYGASVVLVLSFVGLGVLWRRPQLDAAQRGRPLRPWFQRILLSRALRLAAAAVSFSFLVLVIAAALFGDSAPGRNLAPTFVYVVFWLGLVPVSVLLGNVWSLLNPWRAGADGVAWLWERTGSAWEPPLRYPERLGRWPAAVLLFAFAALELAYTDPANPRALALAILLYSWITWLGMAAFGRGVWLANGEAFSVYFGLLAQMAPFAVRERGERREAVVRAPLSGLASVDGRPGTLAFVAVMLGSVAFDGFSRTSWWLDRRFSIEQEYGLTSPGAAELLRTLLNLAGLLLAVTAVALAYLLAVELARSIARESRPLVATFLGSLVPIAAAYAVAHYFSLFVIQGQFAIPLLSDPLGRGWDLLGTADFTPDLTVFAPNTVWYVQVAALVVGHVLGLMLAHDRAVAVFRSSATALRAQYAMLVLMILYTVGGLWLLSND